MHCSLITPQMVVQAGGNGEQLIVDVLIITVMSSVARKGLGSKMLRAVEGIAQQVAALRGSAAALIYTQADEGEIASGFWQRNGFRHSEDAAWLTTALHAWRPHEHMHYKGITSMMRSVDLS